MFSGIVQSLGTIHTIRTVGKGRACIIALDDTKGIAKGDSISISGICSTIVKKSNTTIDVFYMPETLANTTVGSWRVGRVVNIEHSLRVGDAFSGHMVFGHIDGVAKITKVQCRDDQATLTIKVPVSALGFLLRKGSITCDGVALTIVALKNGSITVALTPYTREHTTLGKSKAGDMLNYEIDMIAKMIHNLKHQ